MKLAVLAVVTTGCFAEGDRPPIPVGEHHQYVVDSITVPRSSEEARLGAIDLNGDKVIDNQFGMVLAALIGQGFDVQSPIDRAIAHGEIAMLVDVQTDAFDTSEGTGVQMLLGLQAIPAPCADAGDTVCGRHLDGRGMFAGAVDRHPAMVGRFDDGVLLTGRSTTTIQLTVVSDLVIELDLVAARMSISRIDEAGIAIASIAGGIPPAQVRDRIVPAFHSAAADMIERDCDLSVPECPCLATSKGKWLKDLFDTSPHDCSISLAEIRNNSLVQSLMAPDVTLDGADTLSIALRVTAVPATFPAASRP